MCVIASVSPRAGRRASGTAENTHYIYHLYTHKKHTHIFSHCATHQTTQKTPYLSAGRGYYCK